MITFNVFILILALTEATIVPWSNVPGALPASGLEKSYMPFVSQNTNGNTYAVRPSSPLDTKNPLKPVHHYTIYISTNNKADVYVNGNGLAATYMQTTTYAVNLLKSPGDVIAVKASTGEGPGAIKVMIFANNVLVAKTGSTNHFFVKSAKSLSETDAPWMYPGFNGCSWDIPSVKEGFWETGPFPEGDAKSVWSSDSSDEMYLRIVLGDVVSISGEVVMGMRCS